MPYAWDRNIHKDAPAKMVYDFCKLNGICVTCRVRWADSTNKCENCRLKSLARDERKRKRYNDMIAKEG